LLIRGRQFTETDDGGAVSWAMETMKRSQPSPSVEGAGKAVVAENVDDLLSMAVEKSSMKVGLMA